jgi:hypothetical protein
MKTALRTSILVVAFMVAAVASFAQGFFPASAPPWVYADNYGRWAIPLQQANTYTVSPASACQVTQLNFSNRSIFYAFANTVAYGPVLIQDNNQANSEVVTPTSFLTPTSTTCGPALSASNSHNPGATMQSGTAGLQEAVNQTGGSTKPYLTSIILSGDWYKLLANISGQNATLAATSSPAQVIAAATCSSNTQLVDVTANPWAFWGCNASSKFSLLTLAQKSTVAAGAGAGTSPTIALSAGSTASSGTVTLTTGTTPTASAAVFTVTMTAPNSGGFGYAPVCTVKSIGSQAYTGVVSTTAGSGSTAATLVYTATGTALTASQAGFVWSYSCH